MFTGTINIGAVWTTRSISKSVVVNTIPSYSQTIFNWRDGSGHGCYGTNSDSASFTVNHISYVKKVTLEIYRDDYADVTLNGHEIMSELPKGCANNSSGPYNFTFDITEYISSSNTISYSVERFNQSGFTAIIHVIY